MLSNARKPPKRVQTAASTPTPSNAVVVTVRTIQVAKPTALVAASKPRPEPATSSPGASSSKAPSPPKRKRDRSPEPVPVKKAKPARPRTTTSPPPRPSRSSQTARPPRQAFGTLEKPVPRQCSISEDGNVPHVTSENVILDILAQDHKKSKKGYIAYFRNPADPADTSFQPHPTNPPTVEIEYPNHGASERFVLLFPMDRDDYQPIRELMKVLSTITEYYLTPEQRAPFGSLARAASLLVPEPSRSASPSTTSTPVPESAPLFRTLEKAYHTRNGPLFVQTVNEISAALRDLKPQMMQNVRDLFAAGVPVKVWQMVTEEVYQRSVGPDVEDTKKYKSFSNETYGELNPSFVSDIIHRLGVKPGKTFIDLGSGVGNCVLQAALQAGCSSYGIELNPPVAALAVKQEAEFHARLRMWGLSAGDVTLRKGDFCASNEVSTWLSKADVVLVNNYIFDSALNEALSWRFLDLPEGAKVVVLKPFWPLNRPLTERTADTPEAVLTNVERIEYITDSVSWTKEPGEFFIYTKTNRVAFDGGVASTRSSRRR